MTNNEKEYSEWFNQFKLQRRRVLFPPLLLHYSLVSSPLTTCFNMNLWGNPLRLCRWLEVVESSPILLRVGRTFKRLCWNRRRSRLWERFKDGAALLTCTDGATSFNAMWGERPMMHLGVAAAGSPLWTWWGVILIMETLGGPWPWNKWIKVFHSNNKKISEETMATTIAQAGFSNWPTYGRALVRVLLSAFPDKVNKCGTVGEILILSAL